MRGRSRGVARAVAAWRERRASDLDLPVRFVLPDLREKLGNPNELKNLELAAQNYIVWWDQQSPGAYDAFCKRIGAA